MLTVIDVPLERSSPAFYFSGNSLGLQPLLSKELISQHFQHWATQGVYGHHRVLGGQPPTVPWLDIDEQVAEMMAPIVGAKPSEVAVMQSLTANLHLAMSSFYRPFGKKQKILIEAKAFPSDHFAVESQLRHHGLDSKEDMILLQPDDKGTWYFSTKRICETIEQHKDELALILLPGVHFYSGQFLDIPTITAFARERDILIGWDLAHAVGNVPLQLHDWGVDWAVWCSYKYLNAGPGAIGGLFIHEKHHEPNHKIQPAFTGWWGSSKTTRFAMDNSFNPIVGAGAWQLSNPSVLDCTSLIGSLKVFAMTSIGELREKSLSLTAYLEFLLKNHPDLKGASDKYTLLTPTNPKERGAQISVRLREGLLESVLKTLEAHGIVVDERRPDVIRVAPTPLYNTFEDVWNFVDVFGRCLKE
jgi:kynureninase